MRHNGFVAFILTHGRPDRVLTYEKLRKHGYTGKIYIVCDDEDKTLPEYRKRFGDVLVFSKSEIAKTFDEGDNFGDRRAIIYARNACFELAQQIGEVCTAIAASGIVRFLNIPIRSRWL